MAACWRRADPCPSRLSAATPELGSKRIALQRCVRRSMKKRSSGADAMHRSRTMTPGFGSSAWASAVGRHPPGPRPTAAVASRPPRTRCCRKNCGASGRAHRSGRSVSGCSDLCCSSSAAKRRSTRGCRTSSAAASAGAKAIPNLAPAPTWRASPRAARTAATTSSSTDKRSGPVTPTRPTGCSAWCAPTPPPSMPASPSSCSTCAHRAWRRDRSP